MRFYWSQWVYTIFRLLNYFLACIVRHKQKRFIDYHYSLLEYKLPRLVSNMLFSTGVIHFFFFYKSFFFFCIYILIFFIIFINDKKKTHLSYCSKIVLYISFYYSLNSYKHQSISMKQLWKINLNTRVRQFDILYFRGIFLRRFQWVEISERKPPPVYSHLRGNSYTNFILF